MTTKKQPPIPFRKKQPPPILVPPEKLPLPPIQPEQVTLFANPNDLRRDLHAFVGYVKGHTIKRSFRGNDLPQADYKRLMQVIQDNGQGSGDEHVAFFGSVREAYSWISYLDQLARMLGFVSYNITGSYRGQSSMEPSFQDNFIEFNADTYAAFLALPLVEQERRLLDTLLNNYTYSHNEFYTASIRGRLDRFPSWGSGVGMMPTLKFDEIRRFLFDLLHVGEPGVWYSTANLIAYLKANYPFFLIPQQLPMDKFSRAIEKRYGNFHEDEILYRQTSIPDDAPDGFERVEGRYVERFLEGIPLTLGYVDVAYAAPTEAPSKPSRGVLRAFRINERFLQMRRGEIPQPRVIVQPNFEIYIESAFYPAFLINRLAPLTNIVQEDTTTILKLQKQKVAAQLAATPDLDLIALLEGLSGQALPQNVLVELQDWAGHADIFTLYTGFGLVEAVEESTTAGAFTAERISDSVRLVRDPGALCTRLIESGVVALLVKHGDAGWTSLPTWAHTVFPRIATPAQSTNKKTKQAVTVKRRTMIALSFPDDGLFEILRKALLDERCFFEVDKERRTLTLSGKDEALLKGLIKRLSDEYVISVEDQE